MPDNVVVQSFEDGLEVSLLDLLVHASVQGHIGMLGHSLPSFFGRSEKYTF